MTTARQALHRAQLYLVCDALPDPLLERALAGGVDIVQLRSKDAEDADILATARRYRAVCAAHRALLILNDRPDLVQAAGADGVHVGQDDVPVEEARALIGPHRLVGLSTHSPAQVDAAGDADVDYIGVGPVHSTPTKPGRPAVGLDLVRHAAARARVPFFAIGGIDASNVAAVAAAGARRIAVVRALTHAPDPGAVARSLRAALGALDESEAEVGAAR